MLTKKGKHRPSKTRSWLSRSISSTAVPVKVAFTKDRPEDKKMMMIFLHDHEAETVNGGSDFFEEPWVEVSLDGIDKWALVVEAMPPGSKAKVDKPTGKKGKPDPKEDKEEGDPEEGEGESGGEGDSDPDLEKLRDELSGKVEDAAEPKKPSPEVDAGRPGRSASPSGEMLKKTPTMKVAPINIGISDICFCRECQIKRNGRKRK